MYKHIEEDFFRNSKPGRIISYNTESELNEKLKMEATDKEINDYKLFVDHRKINYLFMDEAKHVMGEISEDDELNSVYASIFDPIEKRINEEEYKIIVTFRKGSIVRFEKITMR